MAPAPIFLSLANHLPELLPPALLPPPGLSLKARSSSVSSQGSTCSPRSTGSCAKRVTFATSDDEVTFEVPDKELTTVMVSGLPDNLSREMFTDMLDQAGFKARYDFVYMPADPKSLVGLGYAFVNLITASDAEAAKEHFQGLRCPGSSEKLMDVSWSKHQGLTVLVQSIRNSAIMHESVPDSARPAVYKKNGTRGAFPKPTKTIDMPVHKSLTTIMVRGVDDISREMFTDLLNQAGCKARYNFVHMPADPKNIDGCRYVLVNFVSASDARAAKDNFQGLKSPGPSGNFFDASWSKHQGLTVLVERFRNSPIMHESAPDSAKPAMYEDGVRAAFPEPTKIIKMKKNKRIA